jgi:alpha-glucosidase
MQPWLKKLEFTQNHKGKRIMKQHKFLTFFVLTLIAVVFFVSCGETEIVYERFNGRMLFSDGSALYRFPQEPSSDEAVTVKIRTGKNQVRDVYLHVIDQKIAMVKGESDELFDYYFGEIPPQSELTGYYFELGFNFNGEDRQVFYSRRGMEFNAPNLAYQFKILPNFDVPDWMKGAVLYQIFVDRFYNGDPSNDVLTNEYMYDNWPVQQVSDWNQIPDSINSYSDGSNRTREFYGGDLDGVIQKLDYLAELGVEGIYFNPLFVSPSNHKYDAQDYRYVDPHIGVIIEDGGELIDPNDDSNYQLGSFGNASEINRNASRYITRTTSMANLEASNEKLRELINEAHKRGIRVILDGVFNHAGSFNRWLDREGIYPDSEGYGAYESADSEFVDYFIFNDPNGWPQNESYEAWYGFKTLPKLHFEGSEELTNTIMGIASDWVSPDFAADGWRLDVAADLGLTPSYNHQFWREFRSAVKGANEDAVILAEVYGDSSSWLLGDQWDTVMNYDAFFEPISWFLTGLEKHSYNFRDDLLNDTDQFATDLADKMAKLPFISLEIAMNQLSNHDHSRFLTRTNLQVDPLRENGAGDRSDPSFADDGINKGIMKQATAMQMFMPGAPTLYYGDEAGVVGFTDPDSRRTYPWGNEDQELLGFFQSVIALRDDYSSVRTGSFVSLSSDKSGLYAFGRWDDSSQVVVATNNNDSTKRLSIPVDLLGLTDGSSIKAVFSFDESSHTEIDQSFSVSDGKISVEIPAYGGIILGNADISNEVSIEFSDRPQITGIESISLDGYDQVIAIRFNQLMNQREIQEAFSISGSTAGQFAWNGMTAYFIPNSDLSGSVTISIDTSISSLEGNFFLDKEYKQTLNF